MEDGGRRMGIFGARYFTSGYELIFVAPFVLWFAIAMLHIIDMPAHRLSLRGFDKDGEPVPLIHCENDVDRAKEINLNEGHGPP
jgi:hypothetical protein